MTTNINGFVSLLVYDWHVTKWKDYHITVNSCIYALGVKLNVIFMRYCDEIKLKNIRADYFAQFYFSKVSMIRLMRIPGQAGNDVIVVVFVPSSSVFYTQSTRRRFSLRLRRLCGKRGNLLL